MVAIYKVTCLINKKVYIGQTIHVTNRWDQHIGSANRGDRMVLHQAIRKHGASNFTFSIIDHAKSTKEADILEAAYIRSFKSNDRASGYNVRPGGATVRGFKYSETHRANLRKALSTPEVRRKMSLAHLGNKSNLGKKFSPERRAKASTRLLGNTLNRGRVLSQEWRRAISASLAGNKNNSGNKASLETKAKMSAAHRGKPHSEEWSAHISKALQGHAVSEETRAKIGAAQKRHQERKRQSEIA